MAGFFTTPEGWEKYSPGSPPRLAAHPGYAAPPPKHPEGVRECPPAVPALSRAVLNSNPLWMRSLPRVAPLSGRPWAIFSDPFGVTRRAPIHYAQLVSSLTPTPPSSVYVPSSHGVVEVAVCSCRRGISHRRPPLKAEIARRGASKRFGFCRTNASPAPATANRTVLATGAGSWSPTPTWPLGFHGGSVVTVSRAG